jgi:hypothetical protein
LHKHDNDQGEYGVGLTPGTCAARDLGTSDGAVSGDPYAANHFSSNDFFRYTHSGGSLQVRIDYSTDATTPVDLDLYVYKSNYAFGDPDSVIIYSEESHSTGSSGSETASGNVPAGVYMINVQQYKFVSGKKASYTLMINGVQQCPSY